MTDLRKYIKVGILESGIMATCVSTIFPVRQKWPAGVNKKMIHAGVEALREAGWYSEYGDSDESAVASIFLAMKHAGGAKK